MFPPSVERESLSLRAPESQSESRLSSARRPRPRSASAYFPRPGSGAGIAPAASQPRTRGLRPRRGEPITERRAAGGDARRARRRLPPGRTRTPPSSGGAERRRKAGEARRFCFVAADALSARGWSAQKFSAASAPSRRRLPPGRTRTSSRRAAAPGRRRARETAPSATARRATRDAGDSRRRARALVSARPARFLAGVRRTARDSASAFGAVVATLESAKKLMVGAEASSLTAGSPSALLPSRGARGGGSSGGGSTPRRARVPFADRGETELQYTSCCHYQRSDVCGGGAVIGRGGGRRGCA